MVMIALSVLPGPLAAGVITDSPGDSTFSRRLQAALATLERADAPIRRLHTAVMAAPATITIRPITDDRATWHPDGDRNRGHTDPDDGRPKSDGRTTPTNAIIYVPPDVVETRSTHWKDGLLVHELVHALDLAYGRYDRSDRVRERRAVFFQNVWRAGLRYKLRTAYHGRFATLDYQEAVRLGTLADLERYIFTRSDFPPPPSGSRANPSAKDD